MQKLFFSLFILLIIGCARNAQTSLEVKGSIKNSGARTVYLEETSVGGANPALVDSANLDKEGNFKLSALTKEETIYNLRLDESPAPFITLINDTKNITVTADVMKKGLYTVNGSPASQELKDYLTDSEEKLRSLYNTNMLLDSLQKKGGSDSLVTVRMAERTKAIEDFRKYTTDFIRRSKHPILSIFVLGTYQSIASNPVFGLNGYSLDEVKNFIQQTTAKFPEHASVALLNKRMQAQQPSQPGATAATSSLLNKPAPDFTLPDVNGKPVSLGSFKGKYVLVDFWASWCLPCRMENPNVVNAYQKFKDKNFTVLGVSLDRPGQKDEWTKAIKEDQLAWTHVSDLKYWESEVVNLYRFEGIPYNVLVNPEGKVIAESLRGPDLEKKLGEVLK